MTARKQRVRRPPPATLAPQALGAPPPWLGRLAFSLLLLPALFFARHPLGFLPLTLGVPLVTIALAGWWLHRRMPPLTEGLLLFFGFATYLLLKLVAMHATRTDDNIYFYQAIRMTQGALPYRDFFFAHPPVHLLVPAAVFGVTGFSVAVAKSIPVLAQGLAGLMLYLAVRRASRTLAPLVLILHLTAYEVLMASGDMNGENLMTLFLMGSLLTAVSGRFLIAGALSGLALGCGMYALATVAAIGIAACFVRPRVWPRFLAGFALVFGGLMALFATIGGASFFESVFAYHAAKEVRSADQMPVLDGGNVAMIPVAVVHNFFAFLRDKPFLKALHFHAVLFFAAVLALVGVVRSPHPWSPRDLLQPSRTGLVKWAWLAVLLNLAQMGSLNEVYDFYMVPLLVALAIPAADGLLRLYEGVRDAICWRDLGLVAVMAAVFALHGPTSDALSWHLWPEEAAQPDSEVQYRWRDLQLIPGLSGVVKTLYFKDHRIRGLREPPWRHYVWNKSLTFSTADDLAVFIREHTDPDETITGASTYAPLVALLADRRIAADEADTNAKRFRTGMLTPRDFYERICRDRVRYLVAAEGSWFNDSRIAKDPFIQAHFVREKEVHDPELLHGRSATIALYRRIDSPPGPNGLLCAP